MCRIPPGHILVTLLRISIPIALGSSVLSIINLVDTKLIMYRLQTALGYSESYANVLYGVYGKVQTLYNLPAAFVTPMTISIVPAIAAAVVQGKYTQSKTIAESALRISAAVAMPMGIGLAVLSYPIVNVLYPRSNAARPHAADAAGHCVSVRVHFTDHDGGPAGDRPRDLPGLFHAGRRPGEDRGQLVPDRGA